MRILDRHLRCLSLSVVLLFLLSDFTSLVMAEHTGANIPEDQVEQGNSGEIEFETRYFTFHDPPPRETREVSLPDSVRVLLKSEDTAMNYSIIPGFFVHGLGHLYAGDKGGFTTLLLIEVGCAVMAALGVYWVLSGGLSEGNHEASSVETRGRMTFYASLVVFVASWLYDVVVAPGKVREHNKRVIEIYLRNR